MTVSESYDRYVEIFGYECLPKEEFEWIRYYWMCRLISYGEKDMLSTKEINFLLAFKKKHRLKYKLF